MSVSKVSRGESVGGGEGGGGGETQPNGKCVLIGLLARM
jgi:hypothetical protein